MLVSPRQPLGPRKTTVTFEHTEQRNGEPVSTHSQVSWHPGTSDATINCLCKRVLNAGQSDDPALPLLVVDAAARAPCRRDAVPLCSAVPHGSVLRAMTFDEWLELPKEHPRSRAASDGHGDSARSPRTGTSFLKAYVDALTRTDIGVLPTVQCCIHINSIVEVNPQSETFLCDLTVICDWRDERLMGLPKEEIDEVLADDTAYVKPKISLHNQVDGSDDLATAIPRCDDSKIGTCKITAKVKARLHSSMDVHDFPFDRQMLYIETQLRSITVDKSKLERGQKARLYVALEDAGSGIVNNKRHHKIAPGADKVQEWDFVTDRSHMRTLLVPYEVQLQKHRNVRRKLHRLMRAGKEESEEFDQLLTQEETLVKRVNALVPSAAPKYQPGTSNPELGTHIVAFELARQPQSLMWTLWIPVFITATLSFAQFGIDPQLLEERLGVLFTAMLTIVAFQYVVRESVPAVPYMTLMDTFVTAAIVFMFVQCVATLYVSTVADAYHTTRKVSPVENPYTKTSNKILALLAASLGSSIEAIYPNVALKYATSEEQAVARFVDAIDKCEGECKAAKEVDGILRNILVSLWAACVLSFLWTAKKGRTDMAFFNSLPALVPLKKLKKLDDMQRSAMSPKLVSGASTKAFMAMDNFVNSKQPAAMRRGSLGWTQEMNEAEATRDMMAREEAAQKLRDERDRQATSTVSFESKDILPPIMTMTSNHKVVPAADAADS